MGQERYRHVRVSVRPRTESLDTAWGVEEESYSHTRYQTLRTLAPVSGEMALRLSREGHYADWVATARTLPAIPDGALLVTFDTDGNPDLWLRVAKRLPRGRMVTLLLDETNEVQS